LYCPSFYRSGRPRRQTFLAAYSCRRVMMRKRRKAWGEEFRFCSYIPPFFFDFFFLAFVGLFTRVSTHNGVCLRILLFSRRHDISWQKCPVGLVHCMAYRLLVDFSSSRHLVSCRASSDRGPVPGNSWSSPLFVRNLVTSADWFQRCLLSRHVTKHIASLQDSMSVTFV